MMAQRGTLKNGVIVPDEPATLPEGTRMKFIPVEDPSPPPTSETREEFLASLRQSVADIKAGKGIPIATLAAELKREFGVTEEAD